LNLAGELKVVASHDLQGLGEDQGVPVIFRWSGPNLMPLLIPWMLILGLLALPPNRRGQAWWIWVPVVAISGAAWGARQLAATSGPTEEIVGVIGLLGSSAALGLAAAWLLGHLLQGQVRGVVFVGLLLITAVMGLINILVSQEVDPLGAGVMGVGTGIASFGLALSITLAGLCCRRCYSWGRLTVWVAIWLVGGWLVAMVPFSVMLWIQVPRFIGPCAPFLWGGLVGGLSFLVLLPFLVLARVNGFYGQRLAGMLGLSLGGDAAAQPPVLAPAHSASGQGEPPQRPACKP